MNEHGAKHEDDGAPRGAGTARPGAAEPVSRAALAREAAVFQLKLVADGLRDAVLIPVSLIAAAIGLLRGGDDADREFRAVLDLGRRSERWINLFGNHETAAGESSMDEVLARVEDTLREQVQKGTASEETRTAVTRALEKLRRPADRGR